jgi:TP901 family phage tail tape measure protein
MADFLPPAVAFLLGNISGFVASMDEADARMAKTEEKQASAGAKGKAAFLGLGVAVAAVAYESVKLASVFDATMTRINTQDNAGLTTQQMKALKASVLDLAGPTAQAPEVLAEAMIHVYGSGLKGAAALDLLKVAAEGATTGHANLVDVTNALDAAVAVGIKGTGDYNVAMGELNATVGAGDMTMQNLAEALGGPMLATVKGYGLSITDVGAALAVFGDRNIRGAEAATELRMATQALAVPAASGARALASIGLNVNTLRDDLQQGGLKQALNDLNQHLLAAGYNSTTAGALITQAFGKKAGGGLNVLLDSLASSTSNFNEKFQAVSESGKTFAADFAQTQDTLAFKMHALGAETQAVGIRIGEYLIPKITDLASLVGRDVGPVLKQFGTDLRTAMDSPAAHQAEAVLKGVFTDLGRFLADASSAARGFGLALEPAAAILTEVFLVGLAATGKILADVVGPALKATAGFFRDNSDVIKVLSEVALAGLAAKLLYVGAIAGIDMFATFATGIGTAITGIAAFVRAVASGAVFDTIRLKAMYAADAVRGVGAASTAAAAEADGAAAGGFGRVAGALGRSLPIIGGVVLAAGYLGQKLNDLATSGDDASMSVDQLTVALMKSGNQANSAGNSMGGLGNTMSLFGTKISGVTDPMAAMGIALGKIDQMMSGSTGDGLKNYDAALAQLVQSGNGDRAAQVIAQVAAATDDHGNKIINTVRDFPAYFAALDAVKAHAALAAGATDKAASWTRPSAPPAPSRRSTTRSPNCPATSAPARPWTRSGKTC